MGNCLNTASKQQHELTRRRRGERVVPEDDVAKSIGEVLLQEEEEEEAPSTAPSTAAAGMKVKVVLTRAELEWLMAQLKSGDQRLEDVLRQVSTARTGTTGADDGSKLQTCADGWRPRLERILECPEAVDATTPVTTIRA